MRSYGDERWTLIHDDCLAALRALPDGCIDSVVTDPPYELGFMGKSWDATGIAYSVDLWREVLRVLKPGGHLLAFGGTRTYHRMACAIEDAGFEIRDSVHWIYGTGFPKSLDVSKAIDATERFGGSGSQQLRARSGRPVGEVGTNMSSHRSGKNDVGDGDSPIATDAAKRWSGWGTALKPAHEPVIWARKTFSVVPLQDLHHLLGGLLWLLLSPAKRAESASLSKNLAPGEECAFARTLAALDTSPDGSGGTGTFSSPAAASTCWSIVSSWSDILAALSGQMTTSTTSMGSGTTTALKTLFSLLDPLISPTTTPACACLKPGASGPATSAPPNSSGAWSNWLHTLSASVPATAIEGVALAVASALARLAESLSDAPGEANTAEPGATTGAAASHEPIVLARRPLEGTVAANVLAHGTGALNIDGCRIAGHVPRTVQGASSRIYGNGEVFAPSGRQDSDPHPAGRWPANVVLTEGEATEELDRQSGVLKSGAITAGRPSGSHAAFGTDRARIASRSIPGDSGGASRFFATFREDEPPFLYVAKPSRRERDLGCDDLPAKTAGEATDREEGTDGLKSPRAGAGRTGGARNGHPTVKPVDLMRYLCRLVTPPGGIVLDPFAGSGTTLMAALLEGFNALGIEREAEYIEIARRRAAHAAGDTAATTTEKVA